MSCPNCNCQSEKVVCSGNCLLSNRVAIVEANIASLCKKIERMEGKQFIHDYPEILDWARSVRGEN